MTDADATAMRRALLRWYDAQGRALPWRVRPEDRARGARPDPYRVWLSEIMLQQTTVPHAAPYYARFLDRWPTVQALAAADRDELMAAWAGLGYYARARNLHDCAKTIAARGGEFPADEAELLKLPGIGAYTAAAIRAAAFDLPASVVDGNVERVIARLFAIETPPPKAKGEIRRHAARLADPARPGDYAQAIMDLGAIVCSPRKPACGACPWVRWCAARVQGAVERYPVKAPKAAKPLRHGACFVAMRDDAVWLRRRPDKGLLGGMLEIPGTEWSKAPPAAPPPFEADWIRAGEARHVFTHFSLRLKVFAARAPGNWTPPQGEWAPLAEARRALPSVFRKALALASG